MIIGVAGLGLIGGSIVKSIKTRTQHTVYGIDKEPETMLFARMSGAIDAELNENNISECDLIFIALRPGTAVKWTEENAQFIKKNAIVVDICGVKRSVEQRIAPIAKKHGFMYIGGHPMAGKERGGFVNSDAALFVGASMILTPNEDTDMPMLEKLKALFIDMGFANLTFTTPDDHDRMIAFTSQLAHVISSAYVKSPEALKHRGFSAGSFNDMTRVARLDEDMWTELFLENSDYLSQQLDILICNLNEYKKAIDANDAEELKKLLKDGKEKKAVAGGF